MIGIYPLMQSWAILMILHQLTIALAGSTVVMHVMVMWPVGALNGRYSQLQIIKSQTERW